MQAKGRRNRDAVVLLLMMELNVLSVTQKTDIIQETSSH